jgi:hypothetical protein
VSGIGKPQVTADPGCAFTSGFCGRRSLSC